MSRDASIELVWGEGLTKFAMRIGELRMLEEKRKAGIVEILRRMESESWYVDDVYETLRIGLIGGGKPPTEAYRLVETYCANRPIVESFLTAYGVLGAGLRGAPGEDDTEKKPETATETETTEEVTATV